MQEISILIGGKAGDGIKQGGNAIARLFNQLGYWVFVYEDYPSLIRGGHNFSIIRASKERIKAHKNTVDILIALNQETLEIHKDKIKRETIIVYDSDVVETKKGIGISMSEIAKENKLPLIVRNTIALGALAKILNLKFGFVEKTIKHLLEDYVKENIKVAKIGYEIAPERIKVLKQRKQTKPLLTGNEAIALGAVKAGLKLYIAYPMTPASSILHFLAAHEKELNIKTVQPENEIAAVLIAEGAAYAGARSMVGTSGGGFALMVEALSLAGQAELPVMFVLSQRTGPSTGVPTYTMQADLLFALNAGHGEFQRIVAAPGDVDEAFYLAGELLNLAWKFQVPTILLSDKHLSESTFSADFDLRKLKREKEKLWKGGKDYKRYLDTEDGVSPLAFPGQKNVVVKATSYEHDEYGITTEESEAITKMINKRARKKEAIIKELKKRETVKVSGNKKSKIALIGWGSTKGVLEEVAKELKLRFIQPLYLEPFPTWEIEKSLDGVREIIDVETNSTGQLAKILKCNGINTTKTILKYDGRPFTVDELTKRLWQEIK
ncbi:2-oxoacid:acceptor oxidoreductase subunit alpha [bacterium]|nr:2-oxoacid:acceptor oxidoreductase subunit alpha [bacterium]